MFVLVTGNNCKFSIMQRVVCDGQVMTGKAKRKLLPNFENTFGFNAFFREVQRSNVTPIWLTNLTKILILSNSEM